MTILIVSAMSAFYQYVWQDKKDKGGLYLHLRRKGRKYRKRGSAKDTRGIIKDRVDISQRPGIVDEKLRIGDLEIDTIIGKNHKGAILTINDRISGFLWMDKLNGKNAEDLALKTIKLLRPLKNEIHTITADNGKEFAEHKMIRDQLKIDFFFARPYHSWERGLMKTQMDWSGNISRKVLRLMKLLKKIFKNVQYKLNTRPRKKLGFFVPQLNLFHYI